MERKTVTILCALAGTAALGGGNAQAASRATAPSQEPPAVVRYADLLQPIPNAVEALKTSNAELAERARNAPAKIEQADWGEDDHHHHHHHHHHEYYAPPSPYGGGYYAPPPPPPVYYAPAPAVVVPPPSIVITPGGVGIMP